MKTCNGCKYAEWKRTANGRLHPSGDGRCTFTIVIPKLPNAFRWGTYSGQAYKPCGGFIGRRDVYGDDCPMYDGSKP